MAGSPSRYFSAAACIFPSTEPPISYSQLKRKLELIGVNMKFVAFLIASFVVNLTFAFEPEMSTADICKVECECWGYPGGSYDPRPQFLIGTVESWGYCPTHISVQELYAFHVRKNKIYCNQLGDSSTSRALASCKKNF